MSRRDVVMNDDNKDNLDKYRNRNIDDAAIRINVHDKRVLGAFADVEIPMMGIKKAIAKVDTGAYLSSIHVENIYQSGDTLFYTPLARLNMELSGQKRELSTKNFYQESIVSSNGHKEVRYCITVEMIIDGTAVSGVATLSDRSLMKYPILIGRVFLESDFVVDVSIDKGVS